MRSSSEADAGKTELDETLTFPSSGAGQQEGEEGQTVELENTVVVEEEKKGDWVVVALPSEEEEEVTSPRKPLPAAPNSVNTQPAVVGEIANIEPVTSKPLPSPPSRRVKDVPKSLQALGTGSGESSVGKISSLIGIFSPPSSSSTVSRYPPPVNVEAAEPPRSLGVPGEGGTGGIKPAGCPTSPLIRISPSSFSKTIPSKRVCLHVMCLSLLFAKFLDLATKNAHARSFPFNVCNSLI